MSENSTMATKPRRPATVKLLSIFLSSQMKPRSVSTASWKPYDRHCRPAPMMKSTPPPSVHVPDVAKSDRSCIGTTHTSTAMSSTANRMACATSVMMEPRMLPQQQ